MSDVCNKCQTTVPPHLLQYEGSRFQDETQSLFIQRERRLKFLFLLLTECPLTLCTRRDSLIDCLRLIVFKSNIGLKVKCTNI